MASASEHIYLKAHKGGLMIPIDKPYNLINPFRIIEDEELDSLYPEHDEGDEGGWNEYDDWYFDKGSEDKDE